MDYLYDIESLMILPFRAELQETEYNANYPGENWNTRINIYYQEKIQLDIPIEAIKNLRMYNGEDTKSARQNNKLLMDTSVCTFVRIITKFKSNLPKDEFKDGILKNSTNSSALIVSDYLLPKLNHLIDCIKFEKPDLFNTGLFKRIGSIDLIFVNLKFEDKVVFSRGTSTFFTGLGIKTSSFSVDAILSQQLPNEWMILSRAVDLVNHGYELEGLIVGYSLLDDLVNDYISKNLPNLEESEAESLIRHIERDRLKIYLGPLYRIIHGSSPFDDKSILKDFEWLNKTRNRIMHQGASCSREDATKGLIIVHNLISKINEKCGDYVLPKKLEFWT